MLDVHELHLQLAFMDEIVAAKVGVFLTSLAFEELHAVFGGHGANDLALGRLFDELDGARRRLAEDLADLEAAVGFDDDFLAMSIDRIGARIEIAEEPHNAVPNDVVHDGFHFFVYV